MKLNRAGRALAKKGMVGLASKNSLLKKFAVHAIAPAIQQDVLSRKQVWQCCTPKSASTFLNKILSALWRQDVCSGPPVPYWRDRVQEPDSFSVYRSISRSRKPYFSGHLHQRFNTYLFEKFLKYQQEFGGGVIVQTRDVKDTVLSLKEMIDKIHTKELRLDNPWLVGLNSKWADFSEEEKLSAVAASYTFWHFDFQRSWRNYSRRIEVDYESATRQTADVVGEICRFFGIPKSPNQIDEAISEVAGLDPESLRLNRGVSGRGKEILPYRVQEMIGEIDCLMGEFGA